MEGAETGIITSASETLDGDYLFGGFFNSSSATIENQTLMNNGSGAGLIVKINAFMGVQEQEELIVENQRKQYKITTDIAEIDGAKGEIVNVKGGNTLGLIEISNAINQVSDRIDPEANVLFGTVLDNSLGDMVEVTVIATGVEEEQSK